MTKEKDIYAGFSDAGKSGPTWPKEFMIEIRKRLKSMGGKKADFLQVFTTLSAKEKSESIKESHMAKILGTDEKYDFDRDFRFTQKRSITAADVEEGDVIELGYTDLNDFRTREYYVRKDDGFRHFWTRTMVPFIAEVDYPLPCRHIVKVSEADLDEDGRLSLSILTENCRHMCPRRGPSYCSDFKDYAYDVENG